MDSWHAHPRLLDFGYDSEKAIIHDKLHIRASATTYNTQLIILRRQSQPVQAGLPYDFISGARGGGGIGKGWEGAMNY